jgi:hypothetical protein
MMILILSSIIKIKEKGLNKRYLKSDEEVNFMERLCDSTRPVSIHAAYISEIIPSICIMAGGLFLSMVISFVEKCLNKIFRH